MQPCGGGSICEHGRQRNKCKECGGTSICQHGRQKSSCKECGYVPKKCEHGRRPRECKECNPTPKQPKDCPEKVSRSKRFNSQTLPGTPSRD